MVDGMAGQEFENVEMLAKDSMYTGLFLGVPGIPPTYIKINLISKERLSKIN